MLNSFVIGNVKMGGTGKTPVSIAILELLKELNWEAGFVSRGYGRNSRGYQNINEKSVPQEVGDEPLLICRRFENLPAAVCENRLIGINRLAKEFPDLSWVVLDDAFQHRNLIPDCSLLLTKLNDLFVDDHLFPVGGLRDLSFRAKKADAIGVTHVPVNDCNETMAEMLRNKLNLQPHQKIILFHTNYELPKSLFGQHQWKHGVPSYLFAGLANNKPFFEKGMELSTAVVCNSFPDHYNYSEQDLAQILLEWRTFDRNENQILTTEKDAVKLQLILKDSEIPIFYLPLKMEVGYGKQDLIDLINLKKRV